MKLTSLPGYSSAVFSLPLATCLTLGGLTLASSGCRQTEPKVETTSASKPAMTTAENSAAPATIDRQAEAFVAQRSEFLTAMKTDLATLNRGIDDHEKNVEKSEGMRLTAGREAVAHLRQLSAEAGKQATVVTTAPATTWVETKTKSEKMCSEIKVKLADAQAQFTKAS